MSTPSSPSRARAWSASTSAACGRVSGTEARPSPQPLLVTCRSAPTANPQHKRRERDEAGRDRRDSLSHSTR